MEGDDDAYRHRLRLLIAVALRACESGKDVT
jgi:hypothetical protein